MLHARIRDLDLADLDCLPSPCRGCMFWQSASAPQGQEEGDPAAQDAWWRLVQLDWGSPGKAIWDGDDLRAYALYAPPLHVQRIRAMPLSPSEDALLLATLWVEPDARGHGHARHLLQALARESIARDQAAIEVYGTPYAAEGGCVLSTSAIEALGFEVLRRHASGIILYRLDLDRTVKWPSTVGHALGEVIATLQGRERARVRPALEARGSEGD